MRIFDRKIPLILLIGDVLCLIASLWLMLLIRYGKLPQGDIFMDHLVPFSFLFIIWLIVFFIAGLYEKPTVGIRTKLRELLVNAQIANTLIAVIFFYFAQSPNITPKTNLFIYTLISLVLILWWRSSGYYLVGVRKQERAILIGSGLDMNNLKDEVNHNSHYNIKFVDVIDVNNTTNPVESILNAISSNNVSVLVIDLHNDKVRPILPSLYNLIFSKIRFIDMERVYEDVFDRMPLALLKESWFLEHVSNAPKKIYDSLKRLMDIVIALPIGLFAVLITPLVALAIKIDDGGRVFITQKRVGKGGRILKIFKFRTMQKNDDGKWIPENTDNVITRVGKFLRTSRLDEFPQALNVIKGDVSIIGPRPDLIDLGMKLSREIPYYNIRNIIEPGLSGWAQIKQDLPPQSLEETKLRLAYDFYYIKNRSFTLDLKIALKTIKTLLSRAGR